MKYEVQTLMGDQWENCWWREDIEGSTPLTFNTYAHAKNYLDDFIAEQHEAVDQGDMQDKYDRHDYRIKQIPDEVIE